MLRLAVVGVGHLGKEHARILSTFPGVSLVGVVDSNRAQAERIAERCSTRAYVDPRELMPQLDAAVIAAPTTYHHVLARELLHAGIPLLIEKPLAATCDEAGELVELARSRGVILQVGHIERFNPAFEEVQSLPLQPRYLQAERCGGFTGRSTDTGVVLDLMIHDLDLVLALTGSEVERVEALGVSVLGGHEDIAQARVVFRNGCIADLTASRVHPEPRRRMQVWGVEGYAGIDFARKTLSLMQPSESLRRGMIDSRRLDPALASSLKAELFGRFIQQQQRDCNQPSRADQLTRELEEFVHCVRTGATPRVDGEAGYRAIEVATRILDSLRSHCWEAGAIGPRLLPPSRGPLFHPATREAA